MLGKLSTKKRSQGGQCRRWVLSEGRQRLYSVVQVMQEGMPAVWGSKDCQAKQTVSTLTCAQYSKLLLQNKGNITLNKTFDGHVSYFQPIQPSHLMVDGQIKYPGIRAGKFSLSLITILLAAHFLPVLCPKNIHRNRQLRRLLLTEKCKSWIYRQVRTTKMHTHTHTWTEV